MKRMDPTVSYTKYIGFRYYSRSMVNITVKQPITFLRFWLLLVYTVFLFHTFLE
jgi:hypothetical protein